MSEEADRIRTMVSEALTGLIIGFGVVVRELHAREHLNLVELRATIASQLDVEPRYGPSTELMLHRLMNVVEAVARGEFEPTHITPGQRPVRLLDPEPEEND